MHRHGHATAAAEYGCVDIQPANFTTADLAQAIVNYYSKP